MQEALGLHSRSIQQTVWDWTQQLRLIATMTSTSLTVTITLKISTMQLFKVTMLTHLLETTYRVQHAAFLHRFQTV